MVDYTVSDGSTVVWTTGTSKGLGDGTSFANRQAIPTDIDTLTVKAGGTFIVVQEEQDGFIQLGYDVNSGKQFVVDGIFKTVDSTNSWNPDNGYNLYIGGGSTGIENAIYLRGYYCEIHNVHFHQDSTGAATGDAGSYTYIYGFPYMENCIFAGNGTYPFIPMAEGYYKNCTFYGGSDGTGYCIYMGSTYRTHIILDNCTYNTSAYGFLRYYGGCISVIGSLTDAGGSSNHMYILAGYWAVFTNFSQAWLKTTDGTNVLSGVMFGAYDSADGTHQLPTCGITGATGICHPAYMKNDSGAIPCPKSKDLYYTNVSGWKTYGSPDSTESFGTMTFFFYKAGYDPYSTTHDMTAGDWGMESSPTEIALDTRQDNFRFDGGTW